MMKALHGILICCVLWVPSIDGQLTIQRVNFTAGEDEIKNTERTETGIPTSVTDTTTLEPEVEGPTILGITLKGCTQKCTTFDLKNNCKLPRSEQSKTRGCFCDAYCIQYGDCCYNYEEICIMHVPTTAGETPEEPREEPIEIQPFIGFSDPVDNGNNNEFENNIKTRTGKLTNLVKCVNVKWRGSYEKLISPNIYVISHCLGDHPLKDDCENDNKTDISHRILVSNSEKTQVYKNMFCAQCNDLEIAETNIWQPHFKCKENVEAKLDELMKERRVVEYFNVLSDNCTTEYDPIDLDALEQNLCTEDVEDSCSADIIQTGNYTVRQYETLEHVCRNYRSDVKRKISFEMRVYKNEHCALCNGELLSELNCKSTEEFANNKDGPGMDLAKFTSFALLIDFSSGGMRVMTDDKNVIHVECLDELKYQPDSTDCLNYTNNETTQGNFTKNETMSGDTQNILMLVEQYLTVIGTSLSIIALFITICVYIALPGLRNIPGLCTMNLSIGLLIAQLLFLISPYGVEIASLCKALAAIQHYAWLAAFSWMSTMAFIVCRTFSTMSRVGAPGQVKFAPYLIYNWGIPVLGVCICLVIDLVTELEFHYGGTFACWIVGDRALIYSFAIPIGCVLVANIIQFAITVYHIQKAANVAKQATSSNGDKARFLAYVKLTSIMGFTWIFGFLGSFLKSQVLFILFIVCNTLQGVFILFSFILSSRTKKLCMKRLNNESASVVTRSSDYEKSSTKL
ncbi:unnamed protein product [Owenia fusiformis]|uniref:Uncharacterized protein n=1 Tax=Owenia fusiformis TaxID=6347 RepID=A0A8S4N270_OWEFU|nr:unnamed protein product [Owenia fusiformis]